MVVDTVKSQILYFVCDWRHATSYSQFMCLDCNYLFGCICSDSEVSIIEPEYEASTSASDVAADGSDEGDVAADGSDEGEPFWDGNNVNEEGDLEYEMEVSISDGGE
jgi:hypothetical protein